MSPKASALIGLATALKTTECVSRGEWVPVMDGLCEALQQAEERAEGNLAVAASGALTDTQATAWISLKERLPSIGQQVITHHFLNRIDMLTFDGENFQFPVTCPVDEEGTPIGFTSCYPADAITHWMPLPPPPSVSDSAQDNAVSKSSAFEKHVEECQQCRNGFLCSEGNTLIEETL